MSEPTLARTPFRAAVRNAAIVMAVGFAITAAIGLSVNPHPVERPLVYGPYTCAANTQCWPGSPTWDLDREWVCAWSLGVATPPHVGDNDPNARPYCNPPERGDVSWQVGTPEQAVELGLVRSTDLFEAAEEILDTSPS